MSDRNINKTIPAGWYGKPYHSLNAYFINRFGEKVYRVSIDAGFTCPNRDGAKGRGGCIFCSENGSRAGYVDPGISIEDQLRRGIDIIRNRYGANKYLAYFQPYTNTYAPVEFLRSVYSKALKFGEVIGISIGTRPDCIDDARLDLLEEIAENTLVIVEYGIQSLKNETLQKINRLHTAQDGLKAVSETKKRKNIIVLAHIILGLPGEDLADMKNTVDDLLKAGVDAFKFHHLYVERNTILEKLYNENKINILKLEDYLEILLNIIPGIPQNIVMHRLFGQCSRDKLIAPLWTLDKSGNLSLLDTAFKERNLYQGKNPD